jgi:type IV pilus assembly protein PilQ
MSQWWLRALLSGGMLFALGCAAHSTNIQTEASSADPQIRLHVETPPEGVQLVIEGEGDNPLVYTAFRLPDPPRLILDLAGVSLDPGQQVMRVDHGAVTTVQPKAGAAGSHSTRIEVGLTQLVDYQLQPNGSKLLVTIPTSSAAGQPLATAHTSPPTQNETASSTTQPSAATGLPASATAGQPEASTAPSSTTVAEASSAANSADPAERTTTENSKPDGGLKPDSTVTAEAPSVPSSSSPSMPDATTVTAVHVTPGGPNVVVAIEGNGRFHPEAMLLSGPRLVIDLPGTTGRLRPRVAVNESVLKQIRIGTHQEPRKVRVVMDLTEPVTYEVTQEAGTLRVSLTASSAAPANSSGDGGRETIAATPAAPKTTAKSSPAPKPPAATRAPITPATQPAGDGVRGKEVALPLPALPRKTANAQLSSNGSAEKSGAAGGALGGQKQFTGRLISLDFQDADLENVLRLMADVSGMNIVVGEGVKGKVTVKLLNVPWDQALDLVLRTHGLGQVREGNILRIDTLGNLSKQQDEEAKAKDSATKAEDLVTRVMYVNYAEASKLAESLKKHLSARGDITIDERTNALIVKDVNKSSQEIVTLLKVLDTKTPQVLIEARIVSADTNFARDLGVAWGGNATYTKNGYQLGTVTGPGGTVIGAPTTGFLVNLPASGQAGSLGNLGVTLGKLTGTPFTLDLRLSAGENKGVSKTISAPKVLVLDNQKAKIEQGRSVPFSTVSQQGTQTTFIEASLTLEVTPHVTPDGSILMDLRVANNEPDFANTVPGVGPPIKKKEAKTNIMIKDGETVVLGGIYISTNAESVSGVPWFYKLPVFGWLFKQTSKSTTNNELLVFLTPKIVS